MGCVSSLVQRAAAVLTASCLLTLAPAVARAEQTDARLSVTATVVAVCQLSAPAASSDSGQAPEVVLRCADELAPPRVEHGSSLTTVLF